MSRLFHPRLMDALRGDFFPGVCNIQQATISRNGAGEEIKSWSTFPGHGSLECRVAPAQGGEQRTGEQIYLDATHQILLAGSYPLITEVMQAVVAGQVYDILLAAHDVDGVATKLIVRMVR